ncbi:MAG: polysaccharide biosynthesis/export family protein [Planctomycetota bacterium]|jgi:protein involved in polysaccharide export with SLBB domain
MKYAQILTCLGLFLFSIIGAGCGTVANPQDITAFARPEAVDVTAENYILQPPDAIVVHCSKVPEIHLQEQVIRPDGKISFESLGEIYAAGKTIGQLSDELKKKVTELYKLVDENPIDIRIAVSRSKLFYVEGQVYLPGAKIFTGRDSVYTAISEAKINPMAWEQKILVIRPSRDANVKAKIFRVNFHRMRTRGELSKDVLLQEGDIIYVRPTPLASVALVIEEFARPIGRAFSTVNVVQGPPQYR